MGGKPSLCPSGLQFSLVRFHGANYPAYVGVLVPPVFGHAPDVPSQPTAASLMAGRWCRALESAHSATCRDSNLQRTVHRHVHEGGREVVVPVPGRAGTAGDRMPSAVGGERRRRCSSLHGSFLCSDAEYRPTYVAPTSFVRDGDGALTGPLCVDRSLGETAPGGRVCAFELVQGQRQRVLQYNWGQRQAPHLSEGRRDLARTRGAARCDPVNCRTCWTDRLYPFLKALDTSGTEHRTRSGRNDAGGSSPLGSFLRSDAKHSPAYVAPTLSFVCDGDSAPIGPPCVDRLLGESEPGNGCAFESFEGGGCFLFCDCCLMFQHDPVFIARPIVPVAEFVAAGS